MSYTPGEPVYKGRRLSMFNRDGWEHTARNTARPAVRIVAVTDAGKVLLVEQYRRPVGRKVIELPAGLSGYIAGAQAKPCWKRRSGSFWKRPVMPQLAGPNCLTVTRRRAFLTNRSRCSWPKASVERGPGGRLQRNDCGSRSSAGRNVQLVAGTWSSRRPQTTSWNVSSAGRAWREEGGREL